MFGCTWKTLLIAAVAAVSLFACNLEDDAANSRDDTGVEDTVETSDSESLTCGDATTECADECVDLSSDPDHCGTCGRACEAPNAESSGCDDGVCQLACADGFIDANGDLDDPAGNGCETTCEPDPGGEICDRQDNDCDGEVDEEVMKTWYLDADNDGYGAETDPKEQCDRPTPRYIDTGGDCNDADSTIHPGVDEVCDERDNNCDGETDEGVQTTYYVDSDGDGFGNEALQEIGCSAPQGYVTASGDCDDSDPDARPDQTAHFEEPRASGGYDYNCDGTESLEIDGVSSEVCNYAGTCSRFSSRCVAAASSPGWRSAVPACGEAGSIFSGCPSCVGGISNCGGQARFAARTQGCQ